ncbi:hypothetical protein EMCRGX_G025879 [Ephydatia muelleri]
MVFAAESRRPRPYHTYGHRLQVAKIPMIEDYQPALENGADREDESDMQMRNDFADAENQGEEVEMALPLPNECVSYLPDDSKAVTFYSTTCSSHALPKIHP